MAKRYARINWTNTSSTPINSTNLNKMDKGIDDCDNAIEALSTSKLDKTSVVNNQSTNTEGYALDARQANSGIPGTLGAKIKALEDTNAPTKQTIGYTAFTNSNLFNAGALTYVIKNGICYVNINGLRAITTGNSITIATLPRTVVQALSLFVLSPTDNALDASAMFIDVNSTELRVHVKTTNKMYYGSFSYPIATN